MENIKKTGRPGGGSGAENENLPGNVESGLRAGTLALGQPPLVPWPGCRQQVRFSWASPLGTSGMSCPENSSPSSDEVSRLDGRRDDSLIPYLQKGVRAAVSELERRYGAALRRRAAQLLDDRALAEDMAQEIMLQCCRGEEAKLPEGQLRAWLYRSLRNRCTDELRKRRLRKARRIEEARPSQVGEVPVDPRTSPGSKVVKLEQSAALLQLIDTFPPELRRVLILRYFEHRSRDEIAEQLGISHSVVKARLVKAVARLRREIQPGGEG